MDIALCYYGCGNESKFLVTTKKKPCCSSHQNKCSFIRSKNSDGLKKAISEGRKTYDYYETLSTETKIGMAWSKGKTKHTDARIKKQSESRRKSLAEGKFKQTISGVATNDSLRWKRVQYKAKDSFGKDVMLESKNEVIFSQLCDKHNIKWIKADRKVLSNGKSYIPDFYLPDLKVYTDPKSVFWIEHFKSNQIEKIKLFEIEYNTKVYIFWDKDMSNWEDSLLKLK